MSRQIIYIKYRWFVTVYYLLNTSEGDIIKKQGKIIKGIAGFYYVIAEENIYECKAKGVFRNKKIKPLVGDNVEIDIIDEEKKKGNITLIKERENELIRPAVSNIDQAMIVFAVKQPDPNLNLLDRFLVMMEYQNIETIICFNKKDIGNEEYMDYLKNNKNEIIGSCIYDKNIDEIKFMLEKFSGDRNMIERAIVVANETGFGEAAALILKYRRKKEDIRKSRYAF